MPRARVKLNHPGMRELLLDPRIRGMLTGHAQGVLAAAQAAAPVDTGRYRASLRLRQGTTDRAVVSVGSDVPYAMVIEAGRGVLSRALGGAR